MGDFAFPITLPAWPYGAFGRYEHSGSSLVGCIESGVSLTNDICQQSRVASRADEDFHYPHCPRSVSISSPQVLRVFFFMFPWSGTIINASHSLIPTNSRVRQSPLRFCPRSGAFCTGDSQTECGRRAAKFRGRNDGIGPVEASGY